MKLIRKTLLSHCAFNECKGEERAIQREERNVKPLSATDVLAPTTMKNAAKCDTSCELQNPVSHQNIERIFHFPGSMSVGVSVLSPPVSHSSQGEMTKTWRRLSNRKPCAQLIRLDVR